MEVATLALFALTAFPLVCTPGPDILFVSAQGVTRGRAAALRGTAGVLLGYAAHGALAAFGVAAVVAAHSVLFEILRWIGVGYLAFLAVMLIRSAFRPGAAAATAATEGSIVAKGFLTSFLNPKGLMMYFAIIPQFIDPAGSVALQASALSALFVLLCGIVYGAVGLAAASAARLGGVGDSGRRALEGLAGGLLALAAGRLAGA